MFIFLGLIIVPCLIILVIYLLIKDYKEDKKLKDNDFLD